MGVSGWLARRAVRATRVLVVEGTGGFVVRVAVERETSARGWRLAQSPADADALVVAGRAEDELADVVERLWAALPGPRARVHVTDASEARAALDTVAGRLTDRSAQAEDAAGRAVPDPSGEGASHEGMDHGGHEGMDHGGHEGMDHGGMDMAPDGIPLAEGADDDRDGLEMDALPVRLGPVLPHWPAGLVLDVMLHGDLVADARARLLDDGEPRSAEAPDVRAARRCDELADALALVGWDEAVTLARSARDDLLAHGGGDARALLIEVRHRVEHSRLLRWSLAGVGEVTAEQAERLGLPPEVVGDCRDRLLGLVERATAAARAYAGTAGVDGSAEAVEPPVIPVTACGPLVRGLDLSVARLVIATLGGTAPSSEKVGHA